MVTREQMERRIAISVVRELTDQGFILALGIGGGKFGITSINPDDIIVELFATNQDYIEARRSG